MVIIVPIHEFNDGVKKYLDNALNSIQRQKDVSNLQALLVYPEKLHEDISLYTITEKEKYTFKITLLSNPGNFDFQSQINLAVSTIESDYFSILEFDDEYAEIYFKNVEEYIEAYPEVDVFLPMTIQVDKYGKALSLINDAAWSRDFVGDDGEQGFLSLESVKKYSQFSITGGVFKRTSFNTAGKFKKNLKLTFTYEFMLRTLNMDMKIMNIAKVGYKHVVDRDDSLFIQYTNGMSLKERKFWFETANKEYYFPQDRDIDVSSLETVEAQ